MTTFSNISIVQLAQCCVLISRNLSIILYTYSFLEYLINCRDFLSCMELFEFWTLQPLNFANVWIIKLMNYVNEATRKIMDPDFVQKIALNVGKRTRLYLHQHLGHFEHLLKLKKCHAGEE